MNLRSLFCKGNSYGVMPVCLSSSEHKEYITKLGMNITELEATRLVTSQFHIISNANTTTIRTYEARASSSTGKFHLVDRSYKTIHFTFLLPNSVVNIDHKSNNSDDELHHCRNHESIFLIFFVYLENGPLKSTVI
jgi:hypothetical protein